MSKKAPGREGGLLVPCISVIVGSIVVIMMAPLLPRFMGPIESEGYLLMCSLALVLMGWVLGLRAAEEV